MQKSVLKAPLMVWLRSKLDQKVEIILRPKSLEIFSDQKVGITPTDASNDWSLGQTIEDQSNLITDNIYYQTYLLLSTPFSIGKKNYGFY